LEEVAIIYQKQKEKARRREECSQSKKRAHEKTRFVDFAS
jgi:hypothetical protein